MRCVPRSGPLGPRAITNIAEVVHQWLTAGTLMGIDEDMNDGASGSRRRVWTEVRRGADVADRRLPSARPTMHEPMGGTEA